MQTLEHTFLITICLFCFGFFIASLPSVTHCCIDRRSSLTLIIRFSIRKSYKKRNFFLGDKSNVFWWMMKKNAGDNQSNVVKSSLHVWWILPMMRIVRICQKIKYPIISLWLSVLLCVSPCNKNSYTEKNGDSTERHREFCAIYFLTTPYFFEDGLIFLERKLMQICEQRFFHREDNQLLLIRFSTKRQIYR